MLPTVSVLMGAYNYERYVGAAIESALAQDYPAERLEIVVVDDGSTDGTADVVARLAREHPDRVRLISQANGGYIAATNRAMAEARGELLALLDADDLWCPEKTIRQVEHLMERPEASLAFCNMLIVDGEGQTTGETLLGPADQLGARPYPRLLYGNLVTQSSIMFRSELLEVCAPVPADVPYADWWLAVRAAETGEIVYSPEPLALYRRHGTNLTGFVHGAAAVREKVKAIAFQLAVLRRVALEPLAPAELEWVWSGVELHARQAIEAAGSFLVALPEPHPDAAEQSSSLIAEADARRDAGDLDGEARSTLRALAFDPYAIPVRERFTDSVARARAASERPHPLEGARKFVVLVDAEALLAQEAMLGAYAQAMEGAMSVSLAIDATRLDAGFAARELAALVERLGLSDRDDLDLLAVTGSLEPHDRFRLQQRVDARYDSPASLAGLRARLEGRGD